MQPTLCAYLCDAGTNGLNLYRWRQHSPSTVIALSLITKPSTGEDRSMYQPSNRQREKSAQHLQYRELLRSTILFCQPHQKCDGGGADLRCCNEQGKDMRARMSWDGLKRTHYLLPSSGIKISVSATTKRY